MLLLIAPAAIQAASFDHQAGSAKLGCAVCHTLPPPLSELSEKRTPVAMSDFEAGNRWCRSCHALEEGMSHPTGVLASPGCNLPLSVEGKIDCLTCHSPHTSLVATTAWVPPSLDRISAEGHRTQLLIEPNPGGELCRRCHGARSPAVESAPLHASRAFQTRSFAGSAACAGCHADIHASWTRTAHARMTRIPGNLKNFEAIASNGYEWPKERIKYVLGDHYVHRFVAEASGTLVVLPRIFDQRSGTWIGVRDYGWRSRFWLKQCGGCHVTGFTAEDDKFVETGVGCESCHGPALNHVRTTSPAFVTNPAKLSAERREMICMSCHTSGLDVSGRYSFPVGYRPGDDLGKFYSGLTPKPGQDGKTFFGDETAADRFRQWEFLKSRLFLAKGLTCDYCQNFRNFNIASGSEYMTHDQYCTTCHFSGPTAPGSLPKAVCSQDCTRCHSPGKTASGSFSIHDHKFRFP
ncbi:MAG: cytochrome c3 family protein [Candidatus Ozemobacteraceae bacterium]